MIKFGPSGSSQSFADEGYSKTEQAAAWIKNRGLDCYEYSFGRGVLMGEAKALSIGEAFQKAGIEISVHAPYFINFANPSDESAAKSYDYVLDSAKAGRLMGGKRVVFHPASQGKEDREIAVARCEDRLKTLRDYVYLNGLDDMLFCPETMGKLGQIGTVEEIARFCKVDKIFVPCVDFGHINAREQGSLKTYADYRSRLEYLIGELGMEKMKKFHVHFSKIQYSAKGEIRHLTFEDTVYGPNFDPLAEAIYDLGLTPYVVSESAGMQAEEAKYMKDTYFAVVRAKSAVNY